MKSSQLPELESSYWLASAAALDYPALDSDIECDVVIIGGGIAGLTAAYKLKKAGLTVAVLEKNTIGSGTTGGTTGKVTVQHGLEYADLVKRFGSQKIQQYAAASQQAFTDMQTLIADEAIDCDWQVADNFIYTADPKNIETYKEEAATAASLGLPATFEANLQLPFETVGAVKFANQACFNSIKYVRALARLVHGNGSFVYEHSNAQHIHHDQPSKVTTKDGTVTAKYLVVATKVPAGPLIGRVTYASLEYPVTSYVVASQYAGDLQGMYISTDKGHYSILPFDTPAGRILMIGGESHLPGIKRPSPKHQKLADYMQLWFQINHVDYRWKAMDYLAYDSLPLIGHLYPKSDNAYFIGGFKKWGLNLSMVAANLITDAIANKNPAAAELFTPHRVSALTAMPKAAVEYFK